MSLRQVAFQDLDMMFSWIVSICVRRNGRNNGERKIKAVRISHHFVSFNFFMLAFISKAILESFINDKQMFPLITDVNRSLPEVHLLRGPKKSDS